MSVRISKVAWQALLAALEDIRLERQLVTYRSLIERLQLPVPAMQTLALALEYLATLDAQANRPLRSALVISQGASRLPRLGFFECAKRLDYFKGSVEGAEAAAWHAAEVVRVFEYDYQVLADDKPA